MHPASLLAQMVPGPEMLPPQVIAMLSLAGMAVSALILWPLARAIGRRIEGGGSARLQSEVADLRERLDAMEQQLLDSGSDSRVIEELEERVGFMERLIASRGTGGDPAREG